MLIKHLLYQEHINKEGLQLTYSHCIRQNSNMEVGYTMFSYLRTTEWGGWCQDIQNTCRYTMCVHTDDQRHMGHICSHHVSIFSPCLNFACLQCSMSSSSFRGLCPLNFTDDFTLLMFCTHRLALQRPAHPSTIQLVRGTYSYFPTWRGAPACVFAPVHNLWVSGTSPSPRQWPEGWTVHSNRPFSISARSRSNSLFARDAGYCPYSFPLERKI